MMRRNTAAAGVEILMAFADPDPDTISESGFSSTAPPPKPVKQQQTNSVLQGVLAADASGCTCTPPTRPEGGPPAVDAAVEDDLTSQVLQENARGVAASGKALNRHLRIHGRVPLIRIRPQGPPLALGPRRVDPPVICAYCNCAFCFAEHEFPELHPFPGRVYPEPTEPITLHLLTPPPVGQLYRDPRGPGATLTRLLVCNHEHHFKATMGILQRQKPDGAAPSLAWRCTFSCLRVLPIVVGSEGADSPDLHALSAPPPAPRAYAGAFRNYVKPGDEDMLGLKIHEDPLNLTLGRR